jgi:hypothetical protein
MVTRSNPSPRSIPSGIEPVLRSAVLRMFGVLARVAGEIAVVGETAGAALLVRTPLPNASHDGDRDDEAGDRAARDGHRPTDGGCRFTP